jgi:hypothetical protein
MLPHLDCGILRAFFAERLPDCKDLFQGRQVKYYTRKIDRNFLILEDSCLQEGRLMKRVLERRRARAECAAENILVFVYKRKSY